MSLDLFSLDGRIALVTGGNGGLGRTMARGLAAAGAQVVVTGRDETKNSDAAGEFGTVIDPPSRECFDLKASQPQPLSLPMIPQSQH